MNRDVAALQSLIAPLFPGLMGLQLTEVGPERVVSTMQVRPDLCTSGGILHGGAVMAFADTLGAIGTLVNLQQLGKDKGTTTVNSSTQFIGAAKVGTTVTGESTAFHRGKTTMVWQTLIKNEAGKLCAMVTQTQLVLGD